MESLGRWIDVCLAEVTGHATGYSEKLVLEGRSCVRHPSSNRGEGSGMMIK